MALNACSSFATLPTTMRGVVYNGVPYQVNVTDLPVPTLSGAGTDAVVRLTHAAICGSDLHMYHESVGDYVVIPDTLGAGHLEMDPGAEELLAYGMGNEELGGLQAEYAHIPNAELNLISATPLTQQSRNSTNGSGSTNATLERDYVTASDIFATGWTALDPAVVTRQMVAVTGGARGGIGQIGAWMAQNATAAAPNAGDIDPDVSFPLSDFFTKGLSFRSGVVDPKERAPELVRLIEDGKASPASVIETAAIGIEDAPEYYRRFDQHEEIKVFIPFP